MNTLDRTEIARLIPHAGSMCLLEGVDGWDAVRIRCSTGTHRDAANPLRSASGLLACNAIEYAAQAAALHGGLVARASGRTAAPGFLASARGVHLHALRLDTLAGPLEIEAEQLAGDGHQLLYAFTLRHAGAPVADGRLAVVIDTPLPA